MIQFIFSSPDIVDSSMVCEVISQARVYPEGNPQRFMVIDFVVISQWYNLLRRECTQRESPKIHDESESQSDESILEGESPKVHGYRFRCQARVVESGRKRGVVQSRPTVQSQSDKNITFKIVNIVRVNWHLSWGILTRILCYTCRDSFGKVAINVDYNG